MRSRFVLALSLLVPVLVAEELPPGQLINKVAAIADANQSYALYLPSKYNPSRRWPILYCLEPGARGPLAVEHFREGAEKYGYIIAASNNSWNGPTQPTVDALNAMYADTHGRFAVDDNRQYLAGMSGGSRAALLIVTNAKGFAGVIAQAAGFSTPETPKGFAVPFYGTAGIDDFNYRELRKVDRDLDLTGTPHRIRVFAGAHGWAPAEVCTESLAWFEVQAMRTGVRPVDRALIETLYSFDLEKARGAESSGDMLEAWSRYKWLAADYRDWTDVAALGKKAEEIKGSKEYRRLLKSEEKQDAGFVWLRRQLEADMRSLESPDTAREAASALRVLLGDQRKVSAGAADTGDRRTARRFLGDSMVSAREGAYELRNKKEYSAAVVRFELATTINPDRADLLYELAACQALAKERTGAIASLKKAVEKGFSDAARLEGDASFASLRNTAGYKAIAAGIAAKK